MVKHDQLLNGAASIGNFLGIGRALASLMAGFLVGLVTVGEGGFRGPPGSSSAVSGVRHRQGEG